MNYIQSKFQILIDCILEYIFITLFLGEVPWSAQEFLYMQPRHQLTGTSVEASMLEWVANAGFARCLYQPFLFHLLSAGQNSSLTSLRFIIMPLEPFQLDLWYVRVKVRVFKN